MNETLQTNPNSQAGSASERKLKANRQNAQLSPGPTSEAGKAISARNNFRHGFTGAFCLLPDENHAEFNQLHLDLTEEHQPATPTESLLVNDMARHYWLYQRALRLQEACFASDLTAAAAQNQLSLYLRYGTTHERAFRRCLADLLKLRKEKLRLERGFESQGRDRAAELRREAAERRREAVEKRRDNEELRRASAEDRAVSQNRHNAWFTKMLRNSDAVLAKANAREALAKPR